jgi:ribonuclease J
MSKIKSFRPKSNKWKLPFTKREGVSSGGEQVQNQSRVEVQQSEKPRDVEQFVGQPQKPSSQITFSRQEQKSQRHTFTGKPNYTEQFEQKNGGIKQNLSTNKDAIKVVALGGVANVTRNMYVYEYKDDIVIIDCGIGFPTEGMLGVDLVIPDITYLKDKLSKIRGIVITHGHEDHLGGLPYLWPQLGNVPIYSQRLTCGMIRSKFTEHKLPKDQIKELKIDAKIKLGVFDIEFYQVSHSIPDSTGIVMHTPVGTLIHQADFKVDWTPVNGQVPDVGKLAAIGNQGVVYMSIDCLRADKPGYTLSEQSIEGTFEELERDTKGMMVITMTSSNITRVQQAINVALRSGRKISLSGRSVINNFEVARNLGYLDVPSGLVIAQEELKKFPPEKVMLIIAGSQGQPGSSLSRAANGDHKSVRLHKNDTVVFSADPIPGSELAQYDLIDQLNKIGCKVIYSSMTSDLHVSGHAAAEELKLMINLAKPKYLLPIGGQFRHMKVFSDLAQNMGYKEEQVILPEDGDMLEITPTKVQIRGSIPLSNVYVDGLEVGDVGSIVLKDRQIMSEEGVVVVVVPVEKASGQLAGNVDVISRGFSFGDEEQDLMETAEEMIKSLFSVRKNKEENEVRDIRRDWRYIRHQIEQTLEKFFYQEIKRNPLILPMVVEV